MGGAKKQAEQKPGARLKEDREMTMLVNERREHTLTVADYEARIWLYKEQIGTGYIGIGRTLNEAKAAGVVPHGEWEAWATATTGLSIRNVQRCMQAANEIRDGSEMARLEMSKALLLLSSGLDEEKREEMARRAADEGSSLRQMQEEIKQLKLQVVKETGVATEMRQELRSVRDERDRLARDVQVAKSYHENLDEVSKQAYARGKDGAYTEARADARKDFQRALRALEEREMDLQALQQKNRDLKEQVEQARAEAAKPPEDYELLKRNQADLLAAAEDAEKRAADAEAELEALRAGGAGQPEPVWMTLKAAAVQFMDKCELMPLNPSALQADRGRIEANVKWIDAWVQAMHKALNAAVLTEGAVE